MNKRLSEAELRLYTNILGDTDTGLTGGEIARFFSDYSLEYFIDVPYTKAPFPKEIPNKRTAIFKNLLMFEKKVQVKIIKDLAESIEERNKLQIKKLLIKLRKDHGSLLLENQIIKKDEFEVEENHNLNDEMYRDILERVGDYGKHIEKYPSIYTNKSEEDLRDLFLGHLQGRYRGIATLGETFNKSGKTDILLRDNNGSNVFIAELKFWKGKVSMYEAIGQLMGYLTWRDTKTALVFFDRSKKPTETISKIREFAVLHPNYIRDVDQTSLSYEFFMSDDQSNNFQLEIMLFHFPN